jgi:hypothetical protein
LERQVAEALRQPLPVHGGEQVVVAEGRCRRTERREELDLHRRVGDVILAPDDVGHAERGVVRHRGQGVKVGAVLADQHRV